MVLGAEVVVFVVVVVVVVLVAVKWISKGRGCSCRTNNGSYQVLVTQWEIA